MSFERLAASDTETKVVVVVVVVEEVLAALLSPDIADSKRKYASWVKRTKTFSSAVMNIFPPRYSLICGYIHIP